MHQLVCPPPSIIDRTGSDPLNLDPQFDCKAEYWKCRRWSPTGAREMDCKALHKPAQAVAPRMDLDDDTPMLQQEPQLSFTEMLKKTSLI